MRLIALVLAVAWGLNWPAVRIMLTVLPPFSMRFIGLGGGALLLVLLALAQRKSLLPARSAWPFVLAGGMLTVALFNVSTAFAQLATSTSRAAVLTFTMPLIAAALAWWLLGERPDRRASAALVIGGAGIAVLAAPVLSAPLSTAAARGLGLPLLAALAWAAGTVATKRWPPEGDRIVLTAWQLAIGAACAGLAALLAGEELPAVWPLRVQVAMAFHILIATAVAYVLWYRLLSSTTATVAALTTLAVPVVGVLGAMSLVGERPAPADWAGFALVLSGAALVLLRPAR